MATKTTDARVARLLNGIEATLDQLSHIPDEEFTRADARTLRRIRAGLRRVGAKLPPPRASRGRPEAEEAPEKGREAYELRQQNYAWRDVAEITGVLSKRGNRMFTIMDWAKRHAERNDLPWPVGPAAPGLRYRDEDY